MEKRQLNLIMTFKKESCCWQCCCCSDNFFHAHTYAEESSRLRPLRHRRFHNSYDWWCNNTASVDQCNFKSAVVRSKRSSCFFVVLSVTRPKLLSATLRMTQLMVFIRVKNILKIYGGRMGYVHVNTKMDNACTYITCWVTSKSYIFVSENLLLALWYFSL